MPNKPTLIADIGGTNARFALSLDQAPWFSSTQALQCADHQTICDAIDTYLKNHQLESIGSLCFAVAGPVKDQAIRFLNNDWATSAAELADRYATSRIRLMNDFESVSYSLAKLNAADVLTVGPAAELPSGKNYRVMVVGPGSGLGVAGLTSREGILQPVSTEGGHTGFAPDTPLQSQILDHLRSKLGRVSNERLLSGPGLVNIHEALCAINSVENPGLTAADIASAAQQNTDPMCVQTLEIFFRILGQVAGDMALGMGAYDGVFIGGGIAQRYPQQLLESNFRKGFENKGRFRKLMETIPTWLITHKNPGLLGASVYANYHLS